MTHEFRHLFTPLRVGGLTLKNRIFSTGHAEAMAEDGKPGPRLRAEHETKAQGGAGLTIIGGSTSCDSCCRWLTYRSTSLRALAN